MSDIGHRVKVFKSINTNSYRTSDHVLMKAILNRRLGAAGYEISIQLIPCTQPNTVLNFSYPFESPQRFYVTHFILYDFVLIEKTRQKLNLRTLYCCSPHSGLSVNDGPHLRRCPIRLYRGADKSVALPWTETSYSDQDLQHNTDTYGEQTE